MRRHSRRRLTCSERREHATAINQQAELHRHPRTADQRHLSERKGAVGPHPPRMDEAASHPVSPRRPLHLLRPGRSGQPYPEQTEDSRPRVVTAKRMPRRASASARLFRLFPTHVSARGRRRTRQLKSPSVHPANVQHRRTRIGRPADGRWVAPLLQGQDRGTPARGGGAEQCHHPLSARCRDLRRSAWSHHGLQSGSRTSARLAALA